ncbi:transport protein [Stigmatella aurantiaca DW4/3-1]|nr:transport protein [Stigmatella aurantiaca DW4/3-1]
MDHAAHHAFEFLLAGKAMTLFSFLFGLGFALQMGRAQERGTPFLPLYVRRLTVLLLLGLTHIFVLWYGDVLSLYAVTGFLLLLFRPFPSKRLIFWSLLFILGTPLVLAAVHRLVPLLASSPEVIQTVAQEEQVRAEALRKQSRAVFAHGSYLDTLRPNATIYLTRLFRPIFISFVLIALGRFLLGFVAGRHRLLQEPERHQPLLRRLLGWGLLVGGVSNGATFLVGQLTNAGHIPQGAPWMFFLPTVSELGSLGLAAFYMAGLALLFQRPRGKKWLSVLAPPGQMALTNYLSQSVIYLLLFRGFGLGLGGKLGTLACLTIIFGIFWIQLLVSHLWLAHFRFGPAEWLWRSLTYGKAQPMRLNYEHLR